MLKVFVVLSAFGLAVGLLSAKPNFHNGEGRPRGPRHRSPGHSTNPNAPANGPEPVVAPGQITQLATEPTSYFPISVTRCELPIAYDIVLSQPSLFDTIEISVISESRPRHIAFEVDRMIVGTLTFPSETNMCGPRGNEECNSESVVRFNATLYIPVAGAALRVYVLHANGNCNQKDSTDVRIVDTKIYGIPTDAPVGVNPLDFLPQVAMLTGDIVFHGLSDEHRSEHFARGLQLAFATIMPHVHLGLIGVVDAPLQSESDPTLRAFHFEIMVLGATDLAHFTASLLTESQSAGKLEEVLASLDIHVDGYRMTEIIITFDVPADLITFSPAPLPIASATPTPFPVTEFRAAVLARGGWAMGLPANVLSAGLGAALQSTFHLAGNSVRTQVSIPAPDSVEFQIEVVFLLAPPEGFLETLRSLAANEEFLSNMQRLFPGLESIEVLWAYMLDPSQPDGGPVVEDGDDMINPDIRYPPYDNFDNTHRRRRHLFIAGSCLLWAASIIMICRVCRRCRTRQYNSPLPRSRVVTAQVTEVPCVIQSPHLANDHVIILKPVKDV